MSACLGPGFQPESMDVIENGSHTYVDEQGVNDGPTHEQMAMDTTDGANGSHKIPQKAPRIGFFDLAYELREKIYSYLMPRDTPVKDPVRPPAIDLTELGLRTLPSGGPGIKLRFGDYSYYLPLRLVCKNFGLEIEELFFQQHTFIRMEKNLSKLNADCNGVDKLDIQYVCDGEAAKTFPNWTLGIWLNLHDTPPWGEEGSNHESMIMISDHPPRAYHTEDDDVMMDEDLAIDAHDSASVGSSNRSARPASMMSSSSIDIVSDRPLPPGSSHEDMELYRTEAATRLHPPRVVIYEVPELEMMAKAWMRKDLAYGAQLSHGVTMSLRLQVPPALAVLGQTNLVPVEQQRQFIKALSIPKACYRIIPHKTINISVAKELKAVWQDPYDSPQQCIVKAEALRVEGEELMNAMPSRPEQAIQRFVQAFDAIHIDVQGRKRHIWADAWFEKELTDEGPYQHHDGFVIRLICRIKLVAAMVRAYTILGTKHQPLDKTWIATQPVESYGSSILPPDNLFSSENQTPESGAQVMDMYMAIYHGHMLGKQVATAAGTTSADAEAVFWGMRSIHLMRARYGVEDDTTDRFVNRFWWEDLPSADCTDTTQRPTLAHLLNEARFNPEYQDFAVQHQDRILASRDEADNREAGLTPDQEVDPTLAPEIVQAWTSIYKDTGLALQRLGHPRAARILKVARLYDPTCRIVESALNYEALYLAWTCYVEAKKQRMEGRRQQQQMGFEGAPISA